MLRLEEIFRKDFDSLHFRTQDIMLLAQSIDYLLKEWTVIPDISRRIVDLCLQSKVTGSRELLDLYGLFRTEGWLDAYPELILHMEDYVLKNIQKIETGSLFAMIELMDSHNAWQSNDRLIKGLARCFEKTYLSHTTNQLAKLLWLVSKHQS